jgi:hypothetical protein
MSQQSPNIQDNNQQILNDIQSLQGIEQNLFSSLENANLTAEEQESIINKINRLSEMRINLYKTLTGVNTFFQHALTNSRGTLQEQTSAISVIEDELNQAKKRLRQLEQEKNNKIRIVEINNYYSQQYEEYSSLMKLVIVILIPIILLTILKGTGLLPYNWYYILVTIIVLMGTYRFAKIVWSIIRRDNMNYQEYDWYFDKSGAPKSNGLGGENDPWAGAGVGSCIGQFCCSAGQTYDTNLNQCVGNSTINATVTDTSISTQVNDALIKGASINKKPDVTLSTSVEPFAKSNTLNYGGF